MTILVIVESPAKAKTIKKYLGEGFEVDSSVGHIRDLPTSSMGYDEQTLRPQYEVTSDKKKVVARLRKKAKSARRVLLATDLDREGEAIAWHLKEVLNLKDYGRIVFNEITPSALKNAVANETDINMSYVAAQEARRLLDRIVGYTVSPWLQNNMRQSRLSAGRVQSVALLVLVERRRSIESFIPENYYVVKVSVVTQEGESFEMILDPTPLIPGDQKIRNLTNQHEAQRISDFILNKRQLKVVDVECKDVSEKPPAPFTTSTLQQAASSSLGFKPKQTMGLAQALYQAGKITYMRTDSKNLSEDALSEIRSWLQKYVNAKNITMPIIPPSPNKWTSDAGAQEAHEAIRPSSVFDMGKDLEGSTATETEQLKALYQLIWKRTVASQMSPCLSESTKVTARSPGDPKTSKSYTFVARGKVRKMPGWRLLTENDATDEAGETPDDIDSDKQILPQVFCNDLLQVKGSGPQKKVTKSPGHFTEASLVKELERNGVGRPSTYASIINTLMMRKYTETVKKKIVATDLGVEVVQALQGNFSFMEVHYTKGIEQQLDLITQRQATYKGLLSQQIATLTEEINKNGGAPPARDPKKAVAIKDCPSCEKGKLYLRDSRNGAFLGCDKYPNCRHSESATE